MDEERIAALAVRGEQIEQTGSEYLRICRGIKPPLLLDKPVVTDPNLDPKHLQLHTLNGAVSTTRQRP